MEWISIALAFAAGMIVDRLIVNMFIRSFFDDEESKDKEEA